MINHIINVANALIREHVVKRITRSDKWPTARKKWLKNNNICAACKSTQFLQVHHKISFKHNPALELDPTNFITLCMSKNECHILLGHGDNFKYYNPKIEEMAKNVLEGVLSMEEAKKQAKENSIPS